MARRPARRRTSSGYSRRRAAAPRRRTSVRRGYARKSVSRRPSRARSGGTGRAVKVQIELVQPNQVQRPELSPIAATTTEPRKRTF